LAASSILIFPSSSTSTFPARQNRYKSDLFQGTGSNRFLGLPGTFDGNDNLNLVLLRLFVGFHFAPPDTSLSVLDSSYQCVVGLTVTLEGHI
jgi:hypothetical protein